MIRAGLPQTGFRGFVQAMERVELRLRKVTAALDGAGIPYAVIGGNAVAAWVAQVDPAATRTTKDVDILIERSDLNRVTETLEAIGFKRDDLRSLVLFVDPDEPSRKSGVHIVWAGERVRPSYPEPAPHVGESIRASDGFLLLRLSALVRMKLTSYRDIDRVHIADLVRVGWIDETVCASLPPLLRSRLDEVRQSVSEEDSF